jgi:uncharacterized protein (DUF488 family)
VRTARHDAALLHHRPFEPEPGSIRRAFARRSGGASRRYPENPDVARQSAVQRGHAALEPFQISYEHIAALGGLRGKAPALPADINGFWENKSFHNYADYALSPPFRLGLERLIEAGRQRRSAIMCSEAVWWRCHRRIVADYLIAGGQTVFHIMGPDCIEPARLTAGAVVQPDRTIRYPAPLDC